MDKFSINWQNFAQVEHQLEFAFRIRPLNSILYAIPTFVLLPSTSRIHPQKSTTSRQIYWDECTNFIIYHRSLLWNHKTFTVRFHFFLHSTESGHDFNLLSLSCSWPQSWWCQEAKLVLRDRRDALWAHHFAYAAASGSASSEVFRA